MRREIITLCLQYLIFELCYQQIHKQTLINSSVICDIMAVILESQRICLDHCRVNYNRKKQMLSILCLTLTHNEKSLHHDNSSLTLYSWDALQLCQRGIITILN